MNGRVSASAGLMTRWWGRLHTGETTQRLVGQTSDSADARYIDAAGGHELEPAATRTEDSKTTLQIAKEVGHAKCVKALSEATAAARLARIAALDMSVAAKLKKLEEKRAEAAKLAKLNQAKAAAVAEADAATASSTARVDAALARHHTPRC